MKSRKVGIPLQKTIEEIVPVAQNSLKFDQRLVVLKILKAVFAVQITFALTNVLRAIIKDLKLGEVMVRCGISSSNVERLGKSFCANTGDITFDGCDAYAVRLWYERKMLIHVAYWELVSCVVFALAWWWLKRTAHRSDSTPT
jgi:hypothetical protein